MVVDEAVCEFGGAGTKALGPSAWWQEAEEVVWGVAGVTHNAKTFVCELGVINVQEGREWDTNDLSSFVHYAL